MAFLIPLYEKAGKSRFNIALGCTGGHHRSVVMANLLGAYFAEKGYLGEYRPPRYRKVLVRQTTI